MLRQIADPVDDPTAPETRQLVRDMVETMIDAQGTGLAAPQVHAPLRIVVFHIPGSRAETKRASQSHDTEPFADPADGAMPLTVLINPEIELIGDDTARAWEGCLSVPRLRGVVPRHARLRYRACDLTGAVITREASGFHARVVQHECDHLDGVLYPQRMTDLSLLMFTEEMRHGLPDTAPRA